MRVDADPGKSELGHIAAADDHRAACAQSRDRDCVRGRGGGVAQDLRAGSRNVARNVEKILDRDGQARQRRRHDAFLSQPVRGIGGEQRALGVHFGEHAPALAASVRDARERRLDEFAAGGLARGKLLRERRDRADKSFFSHWVPLGG